MQEAQISIPEDELRSFCERHHVRKLALFGSVLGKNFGDDSDVDVLVEFEPGHVPGFEFFSMQDELSVILGREVDLSTPGLLSADIREKVARKADVVYTRS